MIQFLLLGSRLGYQKLCLKPVLRLKEIYQGRPMVVNKDGVIANRDTALQNRFLWLSDIRNLGITAYNLCRSLSPLYSHVLP